MLRAGGVLVLAPHPDDETLGCGGLIAEALARRRPVMVVLVTDGGASHPAAPRAQLVALRHRELLGAWRRLGGGAGGVRSLGLPDGAVPAAGVGFRAAAARLRRWVGQARARVVFAPSRTDAHPDHRAAFAMAAWAVRRRRVRLAEYPVWGALPGGPAMQLRVGHAVRRRAALARHGSQLARGPAALGDGFVLPAALRAAAGRGAEAFRLAPR